MISILLPSRGRPGNVARMLVSLDETTAGDYEVIVRLDDDDPTRDQYCWSARYLVGPRITLSEYWNECWRVARGDIFMHAGDDIVFKTPGWDRIVRDAFPPDGIALVHGDDLGGKGPEFGTHGFLHRAWTDAVGMFVPPHFASDFNDTWLNEVANQLGRRVYVPIVTEHLHFGLGKGTLDLTHAERLVRHWTEDVEGTWDRTAPERALWVDKLAAVMR